VNPEVRPTLPQPSFKLNLPTLEVRRPKSMQTGDFEDKFTIGNHNLQQYIETEINCLEISLTRMIFIERIMNYTAPVNK
jgi:hypothetical protein